MSDLLHKLTIGNVTLDNNIILAPMAGVTDLPFRLLCGEQGAGLCCMEMVSAKAILYRNKNTESLLQIHPQEGTASLQLFGSDPKIISEMAKQIEDRPFAILDINMGCPVPKVVNNGEGSALMKQPKLAGEIVKAVVKAVDKPVTVKIRKGFDEAHVNAVEIARIAEDAGAAAVMVHGRTREQYYAGEADWLRRCDDRTRGAGKSLDFQADCSLAAGWDGTAEAGERGDKSDCYAACETAAGMQRGIYRNPGDAQACLLVYCRDA